MKVEYIHASKFGNGLQVATEFEQQMAAQGVAVAVHHIRDVKPADLAPADVYVFSSPARIGKPIGAMRRFLKKVKLPAGTRYALLSTEVAPKPDKTGRVLTRAELAGLQRVKPIMNDLLQAKGLVEVAEDTIYVTGLKGPLEAGWQENVAAFVAQIPTTAPAKNVTQVATPEPAERVRA